jgi:hypothetical protein
MAAWTPLPTGGPSPLSHETRSRVYLADHDDIDASVAHGAEDVAGCSRHAHHASPLRVTSTLVVSFCVRFSLPLSDDARRRGDAKRVAARGHPLSAAERWSCMHNSASTAAGTAKEQLQGVLKRVLKSVLKGAAPRR